MRFLLPAVALAVVGAACGVSPASTTTLSTQPLTVNLDTFQVFTSPELGFEIRYPQDWSPRVERGLVTFTPPPQAPGDLFNVAVADVPPDLPAAAYYMGEVGRLSKFLRGVRVVEEAEVEVADGIKGRGITATGLSGELEVGVVRLIVLHRARVWEVTYLTSADGFDRRAPLIRAVVGSFRLLGD